MSHRGEQEKQPNLRAGDSPGAGRSRGSHAGGAMGWPWHRLAPALALFPPALGFAYQHRSLGDFCFMSLGASHLAAIRARSCSQLCWWECKITPAKPTQLRALRSHEPGFSHRWPAPLWPPRPPSAKQSWSPGPEEQAKPRDFNARRNALTEFFPEVFSCG